MISRWAAVHPKVALRLRADLPNAVITAIVVSIAAIAANTAVTVAEIGSIAAIEVHAATGGIVTAADAAAVTVAETAGKPRIPARA